MAELWLRVAAVPGSSPPHSEGLLQRPEVPVPSCSLAGALYQLLRGLAWLQYLHLRSFSGRSRSIHAGRGSSGPTSYCRVWGGGNGTRVTVKLKHRPLVAW